MNTKNKNAAITPLLHNGAALEALSAREALAKAVQELLREGESVHTVRSYRSAWNYWQAWHTVRYGQDLVLPVATEVVLQFIVDHAQRQTEDGLTHALPSAVDEALVSAGVKAKPGPLAHSTLVHRIAVLSKAHQRMGWDNPCEGAAVRTLLGTMRRAYAQRGDLAKKKAALTKDPLAALLATCDDSLKGLRDRALLLFAWASGGRRRSEITEARVEQLRRIGPGEFVYELRHSKTNRSGQDLPENHKPVVGAAGQALQDWLTAAHLQDGPLFRPIGKGGRVGAGALSPASVRLIVQQRCALAGLEGDFSAHSLRSGFVSEAGRQNIALAETMALTGHRSVSSVLGYYRAESAAHSAAARLFESGEPLKPETSADTDAP